MLNLSSSIGGHSVQPGTRVLVNMWSIHHDPKHWDKPDLFNPGTTPPTTCRNLTIWSAPQQTATSFHTSTDRFLDHQGQRVTPSCFLPFGAGPRVCVGESLARLELFLFLSSLLQRMCFRLPKGAPLPSLQGRLGVVLQPLPFSVVVLPRGSTDKALWSEWKTEAEISLYYYKLSNLSLKQQQQTLYPLVDQQLFSKLTLNAKLIWNSWCLCITTLTVLTANK